MDGAHITTRVVVSGIARSTIALLLLACAGSHRPADPDSDPVVEPVVEPVVPDAGSPLPLGPGCALDAPAFCETFDQGPAASLPDSRNAELNPLDWSVARVSHWRILQHPFEVHGARVDGCRADLPRELFPGQDAVVCDPTDEILSPHLLVVAAEQPYGQVSLRVRRQFDFQDRTGIVVFDADASWRAINLFGWIALAITEDPSPAPSFARLPNHENQAIPRAALEVHFALACGGAPDLIGVAQVGVFDRFVEREYLTGGTPVCVAAREGALNHFEVQVSRDHVAVFARAHDDDGSGSPTLLFERDVDLPFERGYVHLTAHNHFASKYSRSFSEDGVTPTMDAWSARFDNVGFDGPSIVDRTEYSAPNARIPVEVDFFGTPRAGFGLAYEVRGLSEEATPITIPGVDPSGVRQAQLALNAFSIVGPEMTFDAYTLHYRVNGGAWHDHVPDADQLALLEQATLYEIDPGSDVETQQHREPRSALGTTAVLLDVDASELRAGDNTVEIAVSGVSAFLTPRVANLDLILTR